MISVHPRRQTLWESMKIDWLISEQYINFQYLGDVLSPEFSRAAARDLFRYGYMWVC